MYQKVPSVPPWGKFFVANKMTHYFFFAHGYILLGSGSVVEMVDIVSFDYSLVFVRSKMTIR